MSRYLGAIRVVSVFAFSLFLAACTSIRGGPEIPRSTADAQADSKYLISPQDLADYQTIADSDLKRARRNELIDERALEIDTQYHRYEEHFWRERVGGNIAVDWALLAMTGATATIGGENLKAALGAASTGVIGARESFDKQAFLETTMPALFSQMVAERAKVRTQIELNKRLSAADYTVYAAMSDLTAYMRAGTIRGILQSIALDAGSKEKEADNDLKQLRSGTYLRDDAGDRLRAFWKPDGTAVNAENETRLRDWMASQGLDSKRSAIPVFLRTKEMADFRLKAVQELLE